MLTYVTAYYPTRKDVDFSAYLSEFQKLVNTEVPILLFLPPDFDHPPVPSNVRILRRTLLPIVPEGMNVELPPARNHSKDTAEFLCVMLNKLYLLAEALKETDASHFAWIDYRIFYIIKNYELSQTKLRSIASRSFCGLTKLLAPGCWQPCPSFSFFSAICWRYCGGVVLGPRDAIEPAYRRQMELVHSNLPRLTWEVNYWAMMEDHFEWYAADHNDSMVMNLPYSPRVLRPGATSVYVDGGSFRRIGVGKAIEQYLFRRVCEMTEDGVLVIPRTDMLAGEEEHRRIKSTTIWDDPSLMNETALKIPEGAIVCVDTSRKTVYPRMLHYPLDDDTFANGLQFPYPIPDWNTRKSLAVWRGGTSGIERPSLRYKVVQALDGCPYADVKYVRGGWPQNDNEIPNQYYGERMSFEQQCGYKYMLVIDGNGAASSMLWVFGTGCVPIVVSYPETKYWLKDVLVPMVHYVSIAPDLSDLREKLQWLVENDEAAKNIAQNALEFGRTGLSPKAQQEYIDAKLLGFFGSVGNQTD